MPKTVRIKATPTKDKNLYVKLEQDFDLLEILSLKIVKSDVYTRMCADYGVIVGRAVANSGFGIPNAKISVFIPLTDKDELDPVITKLYPYKQVTDKNEEGYRYNLLPKIYESCNHKPTGSFFTPEEVINNPFVLEVFEKYYKFTTKTNASGDFMIWGVPLGTQIVHASIDVSNIGCYSMRPYHFIKQGVSPSKFESSLEFKASENLDTLPQIIIQNKVAEVVPFWGDDELCSVGITRIDFDLRDSGVEITPSATFIGSIITDDNNNYVDVGGNPGRAQGALCTLTTGTGVIEAVRHTVFKEADGCTPKLEYFALENGGKVIDGNGAWVTQVPMNLDFKITNEYGVEVLSSDPKIGIPTQAKYRFRISFDSQGSSIRNGSYLVPNLREYVIDDSGNNDFTDPQTPYVSPISDSAYASSQFASPSYTFSDKLMDYPLDESGSWANSAAYKCEDYFYHFEPNRIYTISNFIDNYRKNYNFIAVGNTPMSSRWRFLGIKSINPSPESRCTDITKEFPVNDIFRGGSSFFSQAQINRALQMVTLILSAILTAVSVLSLLFLYANFAVTISGIVGATFTIPIPNILLFAVMILLTLAFAAFTLIFWVFMGNLLLDSFYLALRVSSFPNCEPCNCGLTYYIKIPGKWIVDLNETQGDDQAMVGNCDKEKWMNGYESNTQYWVPPKGCYVFKWRDSIKNLYLATLLLLGGASLIPTGGVLIVTGILLLGGLTIIFLFLTDIYEIFKGMNEWRVLADIYTGLCQGVFNMKFSNSWINGSLYNFKFMKKARKTDDAGDEIANPIDFYPDRIIWKQVENDRTHYYYRSCPFTLEDGFISQNNKIDILNSWPLPSHTSEGAETRGHCGVNFPTTIMDLGALDACVDTICNNEDTGCVYIEKLNSSSFQPSDNLLGVLIQEKIHKQPFTQFKGAGVNKWFGNAYVATVAVPLGQFNKATILTNSRIGSMGANPSTGRVIDGDIAQLIATNNMMGVSPFTIDPNDPYYGRGGGTGMDSWRNNYLLGPGFNEVDATKNRLSLLTKDDNLITCIQGGTNGIEHTQVVPYYLWNTEVVGGNYDADWDLGNKNSCAGEISSIGYQQGVGTVLPQFDEPEGGSSGDWSSPSMYGGTTFPPPTGKWQTTPMPIRVDKNIRLGTGLFFYFGLRQGATSYDRFINEYLPPSEDE